MAGGADELSGQAAICGVCSNNAVVKRVQCVKCLCFYHKSCVNKLKSEVIPVSNGKILCCETTSVDDSECAEEADSDLNCNTLKYVNLLLEAKDDIIKELREKNSLLEDKIRYLTENNQRNINLNAGKYAAIVNKPHAVQVRELNGQMQANKKQFAVKGDKQLTKTEGQKNQVNKTSLPSTKSSANNNAESPALQITSEQVADAVNQAQLISTCSDIINLGEPINKNSKQFIDIDKPGKVKPPEKRNRSVKHQIVGNKASSIKTVPRYVAIHVYRLHTDTTTGDIVSLLQPNFPEVQCQQLIAKHKNEYASFKVSVYDHNFKKAMEPSIWPSGAIISKFFQPRQKSQTGT